MSDTEILARYFLVWVSIAPETPAARVPVFCPCCLPHCTIGEQLATWVRSIGLHARIEDRGVAMYKPKLLDLGFNESEIPFVQFLERSYRAHKMMRSVVDHLNDDITQAREAAANTPPPKPQTH